MEVFPMSELKSDPVFSKLLTNLAPKKKYFRYNLVFAFPLGKCEMSKPSLKITRQRIDLAYEIVLPIL